MYSSFISYNLRIPRILYRVLLDIMFRTIFQIRDSLRGEVWLRGESYEKRYVVVGGGVVGDDEGCGMEFKYVR